MLSVHGYLQAKPLLGQTDTGGQIVYVLELSKHLGKLGLNVDVYTRKFEDYPTFERVSRDVRIVRIPCGEQEFIPKEMLFEHLDEFVSNTLKFFERRNLNYDVIHSHYWDSGYVALKLSEKLGMKFYHTSHSLGALKRKRLGALGGGRYRFELRISREREIFEKAKFIIVSTPQEANDYENYYRISKSKVKVIPPGVDTERFNPSGFENSKLPKNAIFSLSRIDPRKGLEFLIKAFFEVSKRIDSHLIIGGGSKNPGDIETSELERLKNLVEKFGLEEKVEFTGYIPDKLVPAYYRGSRIFVVPSPYEPFGLTILEAMSSKTPVVVTKFGGSRFIVNDGKDGFLVDPQNTKEFSKVILQLLEDDHLHEKVSEKAFEKVRKKYQWSAVAKRHLELYEQNL
ncbi:MAG: glycosyltransferase [Candidatus Methanofastidiosia archaeon]